MSRISLISIMHLLGVCLILFFCLIWFTDTAFEVKADTFVDKIKQLFHFKHEEIIGCQEIVYEPGVLLPVLGDTRQYIGESESDPTKKYLAFQKDKLWQIVEYDSQTTKITILVDDIPFTGTTLTQSLHPIDILIIYPECQKNSCRLVSLNINNKTTQYLNPLAADGSIVTNILSLFYDEPSRVIVYETSAADISNLTVLSFAGHLEQSIDLTPGINRQLVFEYYDPISQSLVVRDIKTQDQWFYGIKSISLLRNPCRHQR